MGDSGSLTIGFALAALGLAASWRVAGTTAATLMLPILILAVPILDTALVTVVRLLEGRPIYQGGRDHASHRLVRYGLSERSAVALLALIATGIGLSSLAYNVLDNVRWTMVGVVVTFALLVQFASFLADIERRPLGAGEPVGFAQAFAVHWRRVVEVLVDSVVITGSFLAAYAISFGWPGTETQRHVAGLTLPIVLAARYLAFIPFGLYRSVWRYAGARDAVAIACAVVVSEVVALAYMVLTQDMADFSRDFFVVDALICMVAVGASRFAERVIVVGAQSVRDRTGRRSIIVGAGRTGRSLMRELRETAGERVLGFVDDNPRLRRRKIHGVQVLGGLDEMARVLERIEPDIVLVTIPDAPRDRLDPVVAACEQAGVAVPLRPPRGRPRPARRPRHRPRVNATTSIDAAHAPARRRARTRSFADRAFAVIPVVGIALAVLTFYGIEAWLRKTPWVFTDELEWTQISRAIEETGHSARRGDPIFFKTLYVYLLAPFWAIHSTETAYAAIKYMNVVVMTAAVVPTYLLARMMLSKRASVIVARARGLHPGHVVRDDDRPGGPRLPVVRVRVVGDRARARHGGAARLPLGRRSRSWPC